MMHSIWSGSLNFGLIKIPVHIFSGTNERQLNFDMLHKNDLSPIRFARICKKDGREIPYSDIVKGYQYEKGAYVVLDEEDFAKVSPGKMKSIEILHFADKHEIDSVYFEKPYFLQPGKGGDRAYVLLREALEVSSKVAIVRYILRNREHIGAIKPYAKALVLDQMRYADEVRHVEEIRLPNEVPVAKKELEMAVQLIDQLTENFEIGKFKDEYTAGLKAIIEAKIKGVAPKKVKEPKAKSPKVHDIMSLLKESLAEKPKPKAKKKVL